jgi:hypothetical protein
MRSCLVPFIVNRCEPVVSCAQDERGHRRGLIRRAEMGLGETDGLPMTVISCAERSGAGRQRLREVAADDDKPGGPECRARLVAAPELGSEPATRGRRCVTQVAEVFPCL